MSSRGGSFSALAPCTGAGVGVGEGAGSGPGLPLEPARAAAGASARTSAATSGLLRRLQWRAVSLSILTASSFSCIPPCARTTRLRTSPSSRVRRLPGPHPLTGAIEQPLVVALADPLARFRRQLREERRVHVVDLEVARLVLGRDLVRAEE